MSSSSSTMPSLVSTSSTASSSRPRTPESSVDMPTRGLAEIPPYKPPADATKEVKKDLDRAKMPPPPLPMPGAAPRMVRMPSLSEITSHLHIPTSLATTTPKTPPRLSLLTTPTAAAPTSAALASATATTPYTPSGRLKLPASAMTRTRSGSSSQTPTLASLAAATPRTAMERRGSHDTASGDASKANSPENAKPSPLVGQDTDGSQSASGSLRRQPSREYVKGYKDVPSLAAIRQRISFSQGSGGAADKAQVPAPTPAAALSENVKGRTEAGEAEGTETLLEESKQAEASPGSASSGSSSGGSSKGEQHALHHPWTLYFDAKSYMPPIEQSAGKDGGTGMVDYEKSLLRVGKIDTVESFARHMNNLRLPTGLKPNSNYHLFKGDIRPMWEDPANHLGGKWVIIFRHAPHLLDVAWANLTMALVGDILDPDNKVCGIVASNKPRGHRIQIWTREREDVEGLNELGKRCLEMMGLEKGEEDTISLEYQYNASNVHPPPNAFIYISSSSRSFTPSTPSRHGATSSPSLTLPSSGGSAFSSSSTNPSPTPSAHPLPLHPRPANLSINVHHPDGPSPLSNNIRAENRPSSPAIFTPTPSPKMSHMNHMLPRAPDNATIKASMISPSASSPSLGGTGMKRLGSGQGSNAFAGPMAGGARSPRAGMEGRLAPPSPVPAYV